ncbi:MAG: (d)CMP kinase [Bacillota bacterium]|nr:(d)CMP kinase [Bacillota bacterium]
MLKQIAIDGPAGAGKSTVARQVARRLDWLYIDTGAMYRAIGLLALRAGVALDDEDGLTELARRTRIELEDGAEGYRVYADGEDISAAIRTAEIGAAASPVSAVAGVREALVAQQQAMAAARAVVMDGRDIGTVVLPDAPCKVFLTATAEERAARRTRELQARGIDADYQRIVAEINERDYRDSHRRHSPLMQAKDALLLDSTELNIEQVVAAIIDYAGQKMGVL